MYSILAVIVPCINAFDGDYHELIYISSNRCFYELRKHSTLTSYERE